MLSVALVLALILVLGFGCQVALDLKARAYCRREGHGPHRGVDGGQQCLRCGKITSW